MNNGVMNIGVQVSVWVLVFNSFWHIPRRELLDHMIILYLTVWGTAKLFLTANAPFSIPTSNVQRFHFLYILKPQTLVVSGFFFFFWLDNNHPNTCEVLSHCHFDLHFPMTKNVQHLFLYLFTLYILVKCLGEMPFAHFKINCFSVLFLTAAYGSAIISKWKSLIKYFYLLSLSTASS